MFTPNMAMIRRFWPIPKNTSSEQPWDSANETWESWKNKKENCKSTCTSVDNIWLVVLTILKNMRSIGSGLSHIGRKINTVWTHQPDISWDFPWNLENYPWKMTQKINPSLVGIIRSIIGKWLPIKHHGSCLPTCETCEVCLEVVTQQLQSVMGAAFLIGCYRALHNKKYGTIYIYITIYNHI